MKWFPGDSDEEITIRGDGEDIIGTVGGPDKGGCSSDPDDLEVGDEDDE